MRISVQSEPFDLGAMSNDFAAAQSAAGAVVTFAGIVRDNGGTLSALEIEHYPQMSESAIAAMVEQARLRFSLADALVIHRFGLLKAGEMIMMVATAAPHRADAFAGAEFLMDFLKSRAPFWKKEIPVRGDPSWVAAKDLDEAALTRWAKP